MAAVIGTTDDSLHRLLPKWRRKCFTSVNGVREEAGLIAPGWTEMLSHRTAAPLGGPAEGLARNPESWPTMSVSTQRQRTPAVHGIEVRGSDWQCWPWCTWPPGPAAWNQRGWADPTHRDCCVALAVPKRQGFEQGTGKPGRREGLVGRRLSAALPRARVFLLQFTQTALLARARRSHCVEGCPKPIERLFGTTVGSSLRLGPHPPGPSPGRPVWVRRSRGG